MCKLNLLPHNQSAYEKVMEHFKTHQKAAVVHATGTGKSFLGGAVASHFRNVLIVAPNEYVLEQASKTASHAICKTYSWLSIQEQMPTGFDLIWFDEFHRMGATTWSVGCENLLCVNPQAKILGTTATSERSLEKRDMADEWFMNDVVSTLTLTDAWVRKILRVPTYVIGVVSMDDTRKDYTHKIANAKRIDESKKKQASVMLDNVLLNWNNAYGVPRILAKYIDSDVKRIIVFAQSISRLDDMKETLPKWFEQAGIKISNIYSAHSAMGEEAKRQLRDFENDDNDGVKILLSIDMLNEGIHIERVDAVIMFRATISKNIYLQQIGRCFAVGQKHKPIILDLADNLSKACGYDGIYEAKDRFEKEQHEFANPLNAEEFDDKFQVIDTLRETREILSQIDKMTADHRTWEEIADYIKSFHEKYGRLPTRKDDESVYAYMNMHRRPFYKEKYPDHIEFLKNLGWNPGITEVMTFDKAIALIEDYVSEHGKLPTTNFRAMKYMRSLLKQKRATDEQVKIANSFGIYHIPLIDTWMNKFNEMKAVYDTTGSLESLDKKQRSWIYSQQNSKILTQEQIELLNSIGAFDLKKAREYVLPNTNIDKLVEFVKEHGRLPRQYENIKLYATWRQAYRTKGKQWQLLLSRGVNESHIPVYKTSMQEVEEYYNEHGKLPDPKSVLGKKFKTAIAGSERIAKENLQYAITHWGYKNCHQIAFEKSFDEFKVWVKQKGYLPLKSNSGNEKKQSKFLARYLVEGNEHYQEVADFCKDYPYREKKGNNRINESETDEFNALCDYVLANKALPEKNNPLYEHIYRFSRLRSFRDKFREVFKPFGCDEGSSWLVNALNIQHIKSFYEKNGRLPQQADGDNMITTIYLSKKWYKMGIHKIWTDTLQSFGVDYSQERTKRTREECRQQIIDFLTEYHCVPTLSNGGAKLIQNFGNYKRLHPEDYDSLCKQYITK